MALSQSSNKSLSSLHSWCGVTPAGLLFIIFWMGSLSVFDAEIDQWMKPELRIAPQGEHLPLDQLINTLLSMAPNKATALSISPPNERQETLEFWFRGGKGAGFERHYVNPVSGEIIKPTNTLAGTKFLYRFHQRLNLTWNNIGVWIVGFAAMSMLVLLISGIVTHRNLIANLFTFRPKKQLGRSTLDFHNLTGLVALPFYVMVCLSGLAISMKTFFPWASLVAFDGDRSAQSLQLTGGIRIKPANVKQHHLASLDQMVATAQARWVKLDDGKPVTVDAIRISGLGDANASVRVRRIFARNKVMMNREQMVFDAATGKLLHANVAGPVITAYGWIKGMHYVQFDHWPLRWLYFFGGLAGCLVIASGQLFWLRSRLKKSQSPKANRAFKNSYRLVHIISLGSTAGIILATGAFLISNRLLPATIELFNYDRAQLEVTCFYLTWLLSFMHAAIRPQHAWQEQSIAIAIAALAAPLLNWVTTKSYFLALFQGPNLSVFLMDALLLATACIALMASLKIRNHNQKNETAANKQQDPAAIEVQSIG